MSLTWRSRDNQTTRIILKLKVASPILVARSKFSTVNVESVIARQLSSSSICLLSRGSQVRVRLGSPLNLTKH